MGTPFRLIVIGGSLGALQALCRLVRDFPPGFPAAVAVVLHTHETRPGRLAQIVGQHTALKVAYAGEGDRPVPGRISMAPPKAHLVIRATRCFGVDRGAGANFTRAAADRLFESAARVFGRQVIGVVLTGGDSDGTEGLKAIKRHGGTSVVQSPSDARAPGMPTSAIIHDSPDHIVLLDALGPLLERLVDRDAA